MINSSINHSVSTDDLIISSYLNNHNLPANLRECLAAAESPEEKDILLLSLLTAAGSVLYRVSFRYGRMQKRYYPNLQTFIMAGSASGKGTASLALDLLRPITSETELILPGDSTYPAFYEMLQRQHGIGYMHESEGSVITDIWRSAAMSYNTALRKAAEHESLSRSRCVSGSSIIHMPRLSCLLTGTFSQFHTLVPSVENGFFSRLCLLVVRGRQRFDKRAFAANTNPAQLADNAVRKMGQQLYHLYHNLLRSEEVSFRLTDKQASQIGEHFASEYEALINSLGDNFHPSVVRMGITTMRIAAILTAFRMAEKEMVSTSSAYTSAVSTPVTSPLPAEWVCSDEDYATAVLISSKLLLHAADAFLQIEGDKKKAIPEPQTHLQKYMLLEMLPTEFSTGECEQQARNIGTCDRSARRWMLKWQEEGLVKQIERGRYIKIA